MEFAQFLIKGDSKAVEAITTAAIIYGEIGIVPPKSERFEVRAKSTRTGENLGDIFIDTESARVDLSIRVDNPLPLLTAVHEFAHLCEVMVIDGSPQKNPHLLPEFRAFWDAEARSLTCTKRKRAAELGVPASYVDYLDDEHEVWARLLSQLVARRSASAQLRAEIQEDASLKINRLGSAYWSNAECLALRPLLFQVLRTVGFTTPN